MKGKAIIREMAMEFGFLIMVAGILFLFFTSFSIWYHDSTPQALKDIVDVMYKSQDRWDWVIFFFGILMVIVGALMFFDKLFKFFEFKRLLNSTSRATFIKSRDRLEFLAWKLTKKQEEDLEDKLNEWDIKD